MSNKPIRVLLIEDDPYHAEALQAMLERVKEFNYELFHTLKLVDGLKLVFEREFDVILLDLGLPDSKGFDTFYSTHNTAPFVPIVIFTSLFDEELALKTLRSGAQEYLFKGEFDGEDLSMAIMHSIERMKYIMSLKSLKKPAIYLE